MVGSTWKFQGPCPLRNFEIKLRVSFVLNVVLWFTQYQNWCSLLHRDESHKWFTSTLFHSECQNDIQWCIMLKTAPIFNFPQQCMYNWPINFLLKLPKYPSFRYHFWQKYLYVILKGWIITFFFSFFFVKIYKLIWKHILK